MTRSMYAVFTTVLLALVMSLGLLSPVNAEPGAGQNILDDPVANRRAVFVAIYEEAGYSQRDAEYLAARTLNHLRGYATRMFEPLDPVDAEVVLDPDGDSLAIFQRYLMDHGIDEDTATRETGRLWTVLQPGFRGEEETAQLDSGCVYYIAKAIYCVPDEFGQPGKKRWADIRIEANCFDLSIAPKMPTQLPVCPPEEYRYYEIGIFCGGISSYSAAIREIYGPYEGPCDDVMGCECFSLPEGMLNTKCCPKGGCIGCPETWWQH